MKGKNETKPIREKVKLNIQQATRWRETWTLVTDLFPRWTWTDNEARTWMNMLARLDPEQVRNAIDSHYAETTKLKPNLQAVRQYASEQCKFEQPERQREEAARVEREHQEDRAFVAQYVARMPDKERSAILVTLSADPRNGHLWTDLDTLQLDMDPATWPYWLQSFIWTHHQGKFPSPGPCWGEKDFTPEGPLAGGLSRNITGE